MISDKMLACVDCGQPFQFTSSEQDFYAQRGFSEPRRCPACRASRKAARGEPSAVRAPAGPAYGYGYGARERTGPREMFPVTCAACGRPTQVPFRPTGSKPVYCEACFASRR